MGDNAVHEYFTGTTTAAGNPGGTTFIDADLPDADDAFSGWTWVGTSGSTDGDIIALEDFTGVTKTGFLRKAATAQIASGVTYELWPPDMPPGRVNNFLNRAIRAVTRKGAPPLTDTSLFSTPSTTVYDIPTAVVKIERIEYRTNVTKVLVHSMDSVWSELVDGDVTASADVEDKKEGGASNKFVLAAGLGAGDLIATTAITSVDYSKYTHLEGWIKSTITVTAGQLEIILSSTANAATAIETLLVPALVADTWTWYRIALANPETATAIISVGLNHASDIGAATVWLDRMEMTKENTETWWRLNKNFWRLDRDRRQFVLEPEGEIGHALLKLVGRKKPTELTSDSTSCDVEPEYIIAKATALVLRARVNRRGTDIENAQREADKWETLAAVELAKMHASPGGRWVDNA